MISIISSLYNSDKYLKRYAKHLLRIGKYLNKKHVDFEVIIIANSPSVIEKDYLYRISDLLTQIKIVEVERESLYASWNRGAKLAKGDAITFWNVDDIRFGRALIKGEKLVKLGADIVYFTFIILKKHKYYRYIPVPRLFFNLPLKYNRNYFRTGMFCGPFFLVSKIAFEKIGYFDVQFKIAGDFEWCVRAADKRLNFCRSLIFAGMYIKDGNTLSGSNKSIKLQEIENQIVYRRYEVKSKNNILK